MTHQPRIVLSGCSGGGKSTLLIELNRHGYTTFEEPGRRIVREERAAGGHALPDANPAAFAKRCIDLAIADFCSARTNQISFFDRSVIDAVSFLDHADLLTPDLADIVRQYRYAETVFLTPPWQEIFGTDAERTHGFDRAVAEYERLKRAFPAYGYTVVDIPRLPVEKRAEFVLEQIGVL